MKISIIIPAYNEEERIERVLNAVGGSEKVDEIIVVNDGSEDNTVDRVRNWKGQVSLLNLDANKGKANALARGVKIAKHPHLLFLDADLVGLKSTHVDEMIRTYEEGDWEMVLGVFHKGRLRTDLQKMNPHLSGQRVLSKKIWEKLDLSQAEKFGVEMALTKLSFKLNLNTTKVRLEGVTHVMKEEKRGFRQGIKERLKMYYHIVKAFFFG